MRPQPWLLTSGVRFAVVGPAVLHLDRGEAEGLDHLVSPLAPIGGAEGQHRESQRQRGQGQGEERA